MAVIEQCNGDDLESVVRLYEVGMLRAEEEDQEPGDDDDDDSDGSSYSMSDFLDGDEKSGEFESKL